MKKQGLILIVLLGIAFFAIRPFIISEIDIKETGISLDAKDTEETKTLEVSVEEIRKGNLLLINHEHAVLESSITTDVVHLQMEDELTEGYHLLDDEIYLSEEIAHKFSEMIAAAGKDGLNGFTVNSGYRGFGVQSELYEGMGAGRAMPAGHSEHHLGLALDVGSQEMKMAEAPEGKWIEKNAWEYGFILRYPLHKTEITGIQYEPWHIRYVGLPHSAIMQEKDFVLEEYLDYLKEEKRIKVTINQKKYTITYYPLTQTKLIEVPRNMDYDISGNNMDGIIMTVYE
ncbi:D-alanyl-D-alanine carboxypeptidase family protein [Oceanobacillus sp. FSL H7-0719]|uniref:M15 family metallopeptidase n=1 Tax=Oceanobacillus sp. FSL H7-0719 TaxID=2954507 RepID=UPI0032486233